MQQINVQKGRALLDWGGVILGETLSSFENLRDGRIFCRMLTIAQRSVDDDYMEFDDMQMSLDNVYDVLTDIYTSKVVKYINLNQAQIGNELELAKILLLILAVGVKSPLSQCFTSPSFTLDIPTQNSIMTVMDRAFRGCQQLMDMKGTFYEGLLNENMDETIESPVGTSTPNTPKSRRKTLPANVDVASICGSPAAKDKGLNVSITTMLKMRHNRICQFEQKLAKEKLLRNEIEAELQLKDDLLESKTNKTIEMEEKIALMERLSRLMKEDQDSLVNEMNEYKRMSQESYLDLKARYECSCKDLGEFKVRNEFLEKENGELYVEHHKVNQLHEKLEKYQGIEEEFSRSSSNVNKLKAREKEYLNHIKELQMKINSLETILNDEREYHKENIDSMKSQFEKNLVPLTAECLGDIIQDDLKGNIMELERELEEREHVLEGVTSRFNAQIENLNTEKNSLQDVITNSQAQILSLQYDLQTLIIKLDCAENLKASMETFVLEREEMIRCLEIKVEELNNDQRGRVEEQMKLEENISTLKDDLASSIRSVEDLKHWEMVRTEELQDLSLDRTNLIRQLEVEKCKNEEADRVMSQMIAEKEALSSEIKDLVEVANSLEHGNEVLTVECDDLKEQVGNKNVAIDILQLEVTSKNERIEQILKDFSHAREQHELQLVRNAEIIESMRREANQSDSLIRKLEGDLIEKSDLLQKNEALTADMQGEMLLLESNLENEKQAFDALNSEQEILNGAMLELESRCSTIETHNKELINDLNLKSEQVVELKEKVFKMEQILNEERIAHAETEAHMKTELQNATESCESSEQKCSMLEADISEQREMIKRIGHEDESTKAEMRRRLDEASNQIEEVQTLNGNMATQLCNIADEKIQMEKLYFEKEEILTKEIESLKKENDEMIHRLERRMNDISQQKILFGTQLETLESNLKSIQKASESDKEVLNTQRQLIQKLETKSKNEDARISELTRKFQENEEELNNQVESLNVRLIEEIAEKENIRLTLDTLSENNSKLSHVVETLYSSQEARFSELREQIRLEVSQENQQLRDALEHKEEEINHYKEQLEGYEGEDTLKEKIFRLKEERHLLNSMLDDVRQTLEEKQQELSELVTERRQICSEAERSQKEMDVLRSEIQDNNKVIRELKDELCMLRVATNRARMNEAAMSQLNSILEDQREILSLSMTSSKTCDNEECIQAKQELLKNVQGYEKKLKSSNNGENKTYRPSSAKMDSASSAPETRDDHLGRVQSTEQSSESTRRASCIRGSFHSLHQRRPLVSVSENACLDTTEKAGSVNEDKRPSVFATLPRMNEWFQDAEMKENKTMRGLGLGYLLRSEDEPDHMEWGILEKQHVGRSKQTSSEAIFGGTNYEFGQTRRLSLLSDASDKTSRKLSLGTSCTTFSSYHPPKQQGPFGLLGIVEDDRRVEEIKRRNTLCLPHLKSSYPLEQLQPAAIVEDSRKFAPRKDEPARSSIRDKRKSPRKKFSFNSSTSPGMRRLKELRSKIETPARRGQAFTIDLSPLIQNSDASVTSCEESNHRKAKNISYSIGFTPKKALSKVFKKKKEDK